MSMLQAEYQARAAAWSDIQQHLPTLYEYTLDYPAAKVIELGVRWATSTAAFLAAAEQVDGHVWSVDIRQPAFPPWWKDTGRWSLLVGDDINPSIAAELPAEVDVLFIDTSHAFDHTLAELSLYVPRVRPGGVVLCHDTELETPEMVGPQPPFPVAKALDEYCASSGLSWTNNPGCSGLGIIHIPEGT